MLKGIEKFIVHCGDVILQLAVLPQNGGELAFRKKASGILCKANFNSTSSVFPFYIISRCYTKYITLSFTIQQGQL